MACAGSGLMVSVLPHNPTFNNWLEAYDYLHPHGLWRAVGDFYRQQNGSNYSVSSWISSFIFKVVVELYENLL
ncbi:hypothetical protein PMAYCL1PPCAC_05398 [Pristionchus mayeri]|uniref:Uncharacterized protein n=1 Tax=Pristionchus mayeri TaxID=1317129 RepID=A0AAN4ZAY7_9BILA|nr:hypothetical protein PMAYCL1PPCAC_05398 [Pristionchus mayeri]